MENEAQPITTETAQNAPVPKAFWTDSKDKNQIRIVVDNQTPFTLNPKLQTFADWGDVTSGPLTIKPFTNGDGGHIMSSNSPFVGSAGMVGYSLIAPAAMGGSTLHIRLLASNPYMSGRDNYAYVKILASDDAINQANYNELYEAKSGSTNANFAGRTLTFSSSMGQADNATATFVLKWS